MKITPGDNLLLDHQRIVRNRIQLYFERAASFRQRVAHGSMYLRGTAQRISVLHAPARYMGLANFAALQIFRQIGGALNLSGMGTRLLQARVESFRSAAQAVEGHGANQVGGVGKNFRNQELQASGGEHGLRSV